MTPEDKTYLLKLYSESFKKHGNTPDAVLWGKTERQLMRFDGLIKIADLNTHSILDIGCGLGHLYDYLIKQNWQGPYCGLDINDDLLKEASGQHQHLTFKNHDMTAKPYSEISDYGLSSGMFNHKVSDPWNFITSAIQNAYASVKLGLAFNFLSDKAPHPDPQMAHYDVQAVHDFCQKLARKVVLDTHFMEYNVFVYLYK